MNRQYIGARYVPKFFEGVEWVSGIPYERLTIVSYLGTSFTSKIPVPANIGNPADNPKYWVNTGNYNSQVEEYRKNVEELSTDYYAYKEKSTNDILSTDVTANRSAGGLLSLEQVRNKKFVLIGDSYAQGAIANGDGTYTRNFEDGWMYKFINLLGLDENNVVSLPTGGNSFALTDSAVGHFQDSIQNADIDKPNEIDYIIVLGGANDVNEGYQNIKNGIKEFFDIAKTKCPNATIMVGMCGIHNWGTKIPNMFTVLRAYIDGTNENGGVYIKGIENIPKHIAYIGVDNLHLLADGYTAIANNLAKYIVGGTIDFYAYGNCTFTPTNGSLTGNPVIATGICNDISYLFIGDIVIVKGSENLSFNRNGEWNDLGTIGKSDIVGRTDYGTMGIPFKSTMIFQVPGNTFEVREVECKISGSKLFVRWFELNSSKTGFDEPLIAYNTQFKRIIVTVPTYEQV